MSKSKRPIYFTVSVILAFLMAFLLPIQVFAETTPEPKPEESVTFDSLGEATDNANIVSELKERRDECTKHFRMDDGTIMAVTYDCPVHYKNDKGKWVEYDNSLIAKGEATPDEIVPEPFTNKKSNINIEFAPDTKTDNLVKISSKKGNITWKYTGANKSSVRVKNSNKKHKGNEKFTSIDKLTSKANYKSIYKNVDLDCIVSTTGVKENIILKSADAQNEFEIEYNIKGLKAKQIDNRTIKLYKGKKEVYSITAPCMYDANGEISDKLSLSILSRKKDSLLVKLTADRDFIKSNERKFPVTIDPEVTLKSSINIELADTSSAQPNTALNSCSWFSVGTIDNAEHRGLIKCKTLQNYSDKNIVSAKLKIVPDTSTPEMEIEAVPVTSSWTTQNATYNNTALGSEIIDYANTNTDSSDAIAFDLTKYFKKLLSGDIVNNGICLKSNDNGARFGGSENSDSKKVRLEIIYKDYTGLESNLTSHSVPCGQDAVFSVCDYTGSLSVKQSFFEETTERLPLSIYATYHSVRNTTNEHTGYGWHYSFNQTVDEDDNYYIYKDAEGINRYFKKDDNLDTLTDEDDEYTLTYDSTNNIIEIDDEDITKTFEIVDNTDTYRLTLDKSNENSNNTIEYFYNNSGYMNRIHTSLGNYSINRTNDHYITSISTPNNKSMTFVYYSNSSKIARFKAVDGKSSRFTYTTNADEGLLNEVKYSTNSVFGGKVCCSYNQDKRVSQISEYGKNSVSRNALTVTYNNDNTTEFTDKNGNKETYTFDNYGNTVSVLNSNGSITNANDGGLSINSGSDSYTKNYLGDSNEPSSIALEQPYHSYQYYAYPETIDDVTSELGTVTVDEGTAYLGNKSIKVQNTGTSQFFTMVKYQTAVGDLSGKTVTFSSYVKLDEITKGNREDDGGAILRIEAYQYPGTKVLDLYSPVIEESFYGHEWQRLSVTGTIPLECEHYYYEVSFGLRNATGTAWFDCMQLEKGDSVNDYNALSNSDFSSASDWKDQNGNAIALNNDKVTLNGLGGEPAQVVETESEDESEPESEYITDETYTVTETETFENDVIEETDTYGHIVSTKQGFVTRTYSRTYGIEPTEETEESTEDTTGTSGNDDEEEDEEISAASNTYIYQEVPVNAQDVAFKISGTAKAQSVPLNNDYRTFGIALKIKYENDNAYTETHYQEFNAYTDSFQNVALSITPDDSEKVVESVAFAFVYDYNKNTMEVKNAMLNFTRYDLTETIENQTEETTEEPTETSTATESESEEEDDGHYLIDEEITAEEIDTSQPYMQSGSTYDVNGNYVVGETDEAGNSVSYEVDGDGNTTSITDAKGNLTSYTYDTHGNMLSIVNGNSSNVYTYDDYGNLSSIAHNNFNYNYTYDAFDNVLSISVGSAPLVTYTYDNYDKLSRVTYGNGSYIDYTYDDYGRVTQIDTSNAILAQYSYNKKGLVTRFYDGWSQQTTYYGYDCNGDSLYTYTASADSKRLVRHTSDGAETVTINGTEYKINNGTDDKGDYVQYGNEIIYSKTDSLGRKSKVSSSGYKLNYTYKTVSDSCATTKNIDSMVYYHGEDEIANYRYNYDANGNIREVYINGVLTEKYSYDSLDQLAWAANTYDNSFVVYEYDDSGNIVSKQVNTLGKGDGGNNWYPQTENYSISYEYNDSNWKDLLTSYNNRTIGYDAIGNPMSYRNGITMYWENGRELESITKSGNTYSYTYNIDGLRTSKSNGTDTIKYYYDSNRNLVGMKKGAVTALYYYDTDGSIVSMKVGENSYSFIKNQQGDILNVVDSDGEILSTYRYDAWGAVLVENEDESIWDFNPFRYRGYVYDSETGLYYLQSRYYDPKTGRFVNADSPEYVDTHSGSPLSTNMFAYCENNAVNNIDVYGYMEKAVICAAPKLSSYAKNAIKVSGLDNKDGYPGLYWFCGKEKIRNKEWTVYCNKFVGTKGSYESSQYLVRVDTVVGWGNYIEKNWGGFKKALKILGLLTEFFSESEDIRVAAVSTVLHYILSNYVPSEEKYIIQCINNMFSDKTYNKKKKKLYICLELQVYRYSQGHNIYTGVPQLYLLNYHKYKPYFSIFYL